MFEQDFVYRRYILAIAFILYIACGPIVGIALMNSKMIVAGPTILMALLLGFFFLSVSTEEVNSFHVLDVVPLSAIQYLLWALQWVFAAFLFVWLYEWEAHLLLIAGVLLVAILILERMKKIKEIRLIYEEIIPDTLPENLFDKAK